MSARFPGFPPDAMTFFRGLERNNRREWFQARKPVYEEMVKRPMVELIRNLTGAMMSFAPDYVVDPEKAIFRIYRDTRFSKDKTPYKTNIAASFRRRGLVNHAGAGFYFSISAKEVAAGGGIYMPAADELLAVRNHVAHNHREFRRLIANRTVRRLLGDFQGEQLSRVPKGFSAEHPAADLLRYKQFLLYIELDPALATSPQLESELVKRFRALTPFLDFLNAPFVSAAKKPRISIPVEELL
jgi:uncharacterized protein (TIGR02453 family)